MSEVVKINGYDIKDLKAIRTYENVAAMKSDTKLREGQHVKTKGYYSAGDGGSAEYVIKSTSSGYYEELTNELVAELILNDYVTPEMFGAYGDGTHDDTIPLQNVFNLEKKVVLTKTYVISDTITIGGYNDVEIEGSSSHINYSGNDSAFIIQNIYGGNIRFGSIYSLSGSCIKLESTEGVTDRVIYLNIYFNRLKALNKCIEIVNDNQGYVSEVKFYGGQLDEGEYGVYVINEPDSNDYGSEGLYFYNMGFEGTDVNYYFESQDYQLRGVRIFDDRFVENQNNTAFEFVGKMTRFEINTWSPLLESRVITTNATLNKVKFVCPIMNPDNSTVKAEGIFYDGSYKNYIHEDYKTSSPNVNNTYVSSGNVNINKYGNIVIVRLNGITSSQYSYDIVSSAINENFRPSSNQTSIATTVDGETGRFWVRNNGTIAFEGNADGIGKAYYGELIYFVTNN